ncbi:peptidase M23 [Enterococcus sp. JM4C]|uniref:peptidoglycan DD-metalloendopeptidase family protein n=1 Tax=Candidatus Enterococcus huntleyi TaxID=1857217 RepID=UPI001379576E|nr:peptidoglycan DD-metalloendopeptidase family protein [Enterococcus sp. JM4C]KAF1295251.1 peptidase M23 [Enterococcus sp. JM4C]
MIKLKRVVTVSILLAILGGPLVANADELDDKIKEQNAKIETIQNNQNAAQAQLTAIEENVAQIERDVLAILKQKNAEEKKLTDLNKEIEELKVVIAKRDEQIQSQARDVQTNQGAGSIIDIVVESKSVNEAIEKAIAVNTLIKANNDIMQEQTKDKEKLEVLQKESEERLAVIIEKTEELKQKQEDLVAAKLDKEVQINALSASLATEKGAKKKFEEQKAEAERKRQAELKALAEQKAKEEAARKAAEAEAARVQAANEAAAREQAQTQNPATNTATGGQTSDSNTNNSVDSGTVTPPASTGGGWQAPLSSLVITSPYGNRVDPTGSSGSFHDGVDFAGAAGTPVFASKGGTVVEAGFHWSAGNHVIIKHADGYYSYYMHLSSFNVSNGQAVSAGTVVGGMGTTGNSTGVHLHFGVSTGLWSGFVNPAPLLGL